MKCKLHTGKIFDLFGELDVSLLFVEVYCHNSIYNIMLILDGLHEYFSHSNGKLKDEPIAVSCYCSVFHCIESTVKMLGTGIVL